MRHAFFWRWRLLPLLLACALGQAAPPAPVPGGFTLVVVPDSQKYVWQRPELYTLQTGWIAANVERYQIAYVLHVGDVTQHNTAEQWDRARRAHRVFAGLVPAAYVPGNHDLGEEGNASSRASLMSEYISMAELQQESRLGGVYDREPGRSENSFHTFRAGGRDWLVIALEFGPRDDVVRWANEVVAAHPGHAAILLTHAYLRPNATRFDRQVPIRDERGRDRGLERYGLSAAAEGFNDGEELWQKLVSRHRNFVLVLCGHVCTSAHMVSVGEHGNEVHQILVDYQDAPNGGDGWLRLLQFLPDGTTVRVRDYSPLLDQTSVDPACAFEFQLPAPGRR